MRKSMAAIAIGLISLCGAQANSASFTNLSSDDEQVAKAANTPAAVTMSGDPTPGYSVSGSKETIKEAGDYFAIAAAQVGGSTTGNVYLWTRINGKDVPDSNSIQYIPSKSFTAVLVSQGEVTFKAGDTFEIMYSASAAGLGLIVSKPPGIPTVPSMIFTAYKLN